MQKTAGHSDILTSHGDNYEMRFLRGNAEADAIELVGYHVEATLNGKPLLYKVGLLRPDGNSISIDNVYELRFLAESLWE